MPVVGLDCLQMWRTEKLLFRVCDYFIHLDNSDDLDDEMG